VLSASICLARVRQAARERSAIAEVAVHWIFNACLQFPAPDGDPPLNPLAIWSLVPIALGVAIAHPGAVSRLVQQNQTVLRVPVQPRPAMPHFDWKEHKGPTCIPIAAVRRALLSAPEQVDFILGNGSRVRAKFDKDCPALDFYGNFYLQSPDAQLCVERDAIHSRMGGSCPIKRFRLLEPRLP
jgi:hypothetical protein